MLYENFSTWEKWSRLKYLVIFGRIFLQHTPCVQRFLVLDGNCWTLRHGQAFLPVSRKQTLVHVHTKMLSHPGRAATSMSLASISSRVKLTSMMAGDKNCNFTLCKTSRIGTFHRVVHDVSSFSKQKTKTNRWACAVRTRIKLLIAKINTETQIKTPWQQFYEFLFHFPQF